MRVHKNKIYSVVCKDPKQRNDWNELKIIMVDYNPHFPSNSKLFLECAYGHILNPTDMSKVR